MRPVRLGDSAPDDIEAQVPAERLDDFRRHGSGAILEALAEDDAIWEEVGIHHGPGRSNQRLRKYLVGDGMTPSFREINASTSNRNAPSGVLPSSM